MIGFLHNSVYSRLLRPSFAGMFFFEIFRKQIPTVFFPAGWEVVESQLQALREEHEMLKLEQSAMRRCLLGIDAGDVFVVFFVAWGRMKRRSWVSMLEIIVSS